MTDTAPTFTVEEARYLLGMIGFQVVAMLRGGAVLGHASIQATIDPYIPTAPYPPTNDLEAARAVICEMAMGDAPGDILDRHPWLDLALDSLPKPNRSAGV